MYFHINFLDRLNINIKGSKKLKEVCSEYFVGMINEGYKEEANFTINHVVSKDDYYVPNIKCNNNLVKGFSAPYYYIEMDQDACYASTSEKEKKGHHNIKRKEDELEITTYGKNDENIVVRVTREILSQELLKNDFIPVHGSSVSDDNGNISVFFAQSGKGKSTSVFSSVIFDNKNPVSGDVTFIKKREDGIEAVGFPWKVTIGEGYLEKLNINNLNEYSIKLKNGKTAFTPYNFAKIFNNKKWVWKGKVSNFYLVYLDINKTPEIEKIDRKKTGKYLLENGIENVWQFGDFLGLKAISPNYNNLLSFKYDGIEFNKIKGNILSYYSKSKRLIHTSSKKIGKEIKWENMLT